MKWNTKKWALRHLLSGCLCFCWVVPAPAFDESEIKMEADHVDFDIESGVTNFKGNVNIEYEGSVLTSETAAVDTAQKKGRADGNVVILSKGRVFLSDSVDYDFENNKGEMLEAMTPGPSWIIRGDRVEQLSKDEIIVSRAKVFTSSHSNPVFHLSAHTVNIRPDKKLVAKNVVFWMGSVPVFYWPHYVRRLDGQENFLKVGLGHNQEFGNQFFSRFNFPVGENVETHVDLDWYEKRGLGIGADAKWTYSQGWMRTTNYYISDDEFNPNRSDEKAGSLDRYGFSLEHYHRFSGFDNRLFSNLELNIQSDLDFHDDFFSSAFDEDIQTDNRYRLSYSDERFSTGLSFRAKLNDFYDVLERLPQVHFDLHTFELVEQSGIYFSSTNQAVYLQQDFTEGLEENEAFRFHTSNEINYSRKLWGWLSFNPGIRLDTTYYSETPERETVTTIVDGLPVSTVVTREGDSEVRWSSFFSVNFTTNMYKVFEPRGELFGFNSFRHILTPTLSFNYIPESSEKNADVYQFDEVDRRFDEDITEVAISVISRWQGKTRGGVTAPETLVNTRYSLGLDLEADDNPWTNFVVDSQIRLSETLRMDYQVILDANDGEFELFRSDLAWKVNSNLGLSMGFLHGDRQDNILTPELSLKMGPSLFLRGYLYYNESESLVQRSEISVVKSFRGLDFSVQYMEKDFRDEEIIYFRVTPKNLNSRGFGFKY